jgi:flagellar motor switch protein FliN/FliY
MPDEPQHQALVPVAPDADHALHLGELDLTGPLALLPIELDVSIPVREFRVRQLLALEPGQLIETQWHNGDDVPLAAADVHLAWSEFEVIEAELAVRVTRLP